MRIGFMVTDVPSTIQVDFCLHNEASPNPGFEIGPVAHNLGISGGLTYPLLTHYLTLTQGTYDVRTVAATATTCSQPYFGTQDTVPAFIVNSGEHLTAGAYGALGSSSTQDQERIGQTSDEIAPLVAGGTAYRFIHVAPNVGDLTLSDTTDPAHKTIIFYDGYFGYPAVNDNLDKYQQATPGTFSFTITKINTSVVFAQATNVTLAPNTTYTIFAIGDGLNKPAQLLFCVDDLIPAAPGSAQANCTAY